MSIGYSDSGTYKPEACNAEQSYGADGIAITSDVPSWSVTMYVEGGANGAGWSDGGWCLTSRPQAARSMYVRRLGHA